MYSKNKTQPANFNVWFKNNYFKVILALVGFVLLFPLVRYIKAQLEKSRLQQIEFDVVHGHEEKLNPALNEVKANKVTQRKDVQTAAKNLAFYLKHDVTNNEPNWFQKIFSNAVTSKDGFEIEKILMIQRLNFNSLSKLYNTVYTDNRILIDDLQHEMSVERMLRIRKLLKL